MLRRLQWLCSALLGVALCAGCAETRTTTVANEPAQAATEYRVGPGDQLNIFVFDHPELSLGVPVRPDGKISIPLAEDLQASGKTPSQLARDLETRLSE